MEKVRALKWTTEELIKENKIPSIQETDSVLNLMLLQHGYSHSIYSYVDTDKDPEFILDLINLYKFTEKISSKKIFNNRSLNLISELSTKLIENDEIYIYDHKLMVTDVYDNTDRTFDHGLLFELNTELKIPPYVVTIVAMIAHNNLPEVRTVTFTLNNRGIGFMGNSIFPNVNEIKELLDDRDMVELYLGQDYICPEEIIDFINLDLVNYINRNDPIFTLNHMGSSNSALFH